MSFSEAQNTSLAAPLSSSHVKGRKQAGRNVSYIESWRVISEANRIFGFDGWTSETVNLSCVADNPRKIGEAKRDGFGVSYTCKVRVTVYAGDTLVHREGVGAGHGIDVDQGQAHESAIKEAESDARKRALMTFGNQFGLALYDKEQAGVVDEPTAKNTLIERCHKTIAGSVDAKVLGEWWNSAAEKSARQFAGLDQSECDALKNLVVAKRAALTPKTNGAANDQDRRDAKQTMIDAG